MSTDSSVQINGQEIPVISTNTVVVGTGSAGYCAADRLVQYGQRDLVIVTDRINTGSSRNTGSDKQTYYKLTLAGSGEDSVAQMAQTLYDGGAMDGEHALVEAALSSQAFLHLVDLGVPFPRNRYGEFVGYKTDHDPRQRATSVGPYTSRTMVERLEAKVQADRTRVVDNARVVDVLSHAGKVVGLLLLRREITEEQVATGESKFLLVRARSVIYATGGPAGMYARSVFPHGQWGASGAAYRAGASGKNLTEWQFGMASIAPRWNVSGSYMQVLPRFVSTDADGGDEREFLAEAIADYGRLLSLVFLKGYQWPFDIRKAGDGSSLIDLLVYRETVLRGRRVFLDFTRNPVCEQLDANALSAEARDYLEQAGVLFGTPVQRLRAMNEPAYQLYREKNPSIDLERDLLEIDVCVQHNNGGLSVDAWWQSPTLEGFFPVGEAAGAHGIYRPGGSALNSTQVGATRAAQYIAARRAGEPVDTGEFVQAASAAVLEAQALLEGAYRRHADGEADTTAHMLARAQQLMSEKAGAVRSAASVRQAREQVRAWLEGFASEVVAASSSRRSSERVFLIRDILTTQYVYLSAMADYLEHGGRSRGSVLYTDPDGQAPAGLSEEFSFSLDGGALDEQIQEVTLPHIGVGELPELVASWRARRPLPDTSSDFFENIWRDYRENGNIV